MTLARGDASGLRWFTPTPEGALRAYLAPILVLPLHLILSFMFYLNGDFETGFVAYTLVEVSAYIIAWTIFPVLMHPLSAVMGFRERYHQLVVAYVWAGVLQSLAFFPIGFITAASGLTPVLLLFQVVFLMAVLVYLGFVLRAALEVTTGTAIALVTLDLILSLFVQGYAERLTP